MTQVLPIDNQTLGIVALALFGPIIIVVAAKLLSMGATWCYKKLLGAKNTLRVWAILLLTGFAGAILAFARDGIATVLRVPETKFAEVTGALFIIGILIIAFVLVIGYFRYRSQIHAVTGFSKRQVQKRREARRAKASSSETSENWITALMIVFVIIVAYFILLVLGVRVL